MNGPSHPKLYKNSFISDQYWPLNSFIWIFSFLFWNDIKNGLLCHCPKSNGPFPSYATVGGRDSQNSPIFYYDNSVRFLQTIRLSNKSVTNGGVSVHDLTILAKHFLGFDPIPREPVNAAWVMEYHGLG